MPQNPIAVRHKRRPPKCVAAARGSYRWPERKSWLTRLQRDDCAAGECYNLFTKEDLVSSSARAKKPPVMTGRKPTSRTATRSAFAVCAFSRRANSYAVQVSAQNVLFFTANFHSDFRPPISDL